MTANPAALAARVRDLRTERSWSQEHLAGAAGLSLRTVQRVESGYPVSADTLLALAAALDTPATELTRLVPSPPANGERHLGLTARQASWLGLALVLPAALFVAINLVNEAWGAGWTGRYLDEIAPSLWLDSPVAILGGLSLALILNLPQVVRFDVRRPGVGLVVDRLQLRLTLGTVAVLVAGMGCLAMLGAYLIAENIGHLAAGSVGP